MLIYFWKSNQCSMSLETNKHKTDKFIVSRINQMIGSELACPLTHARIYKQTCVHIAVWYATNTLCKCARTW